MIWDEEAEKAVLGAVLLRPAALDRVDLVPGDFYSPAQREVFAAMLELRRAKKPIDVLAVNDALGETAQAVGGLAALSAMYNATATADNVEHYAEIIRRKALTRQIREKLSAALASDEEGDELLGRAQEAIGQVNKRLPDESSAMDDLARETFADMSERCDGKERDVCATGLVDLDHLLGGGIEPGTLNVIGGWTSEGKSALLRCLANNMARAGHGVDYYGLEDSHRSLGMRALADNAQVGLQRLREFSARSKPNRSEMDSMISAVDSLAFKNWRITSRAGLSSAQIAQRVRRHRDELGTKVVFVDYLQLLKESGSSLRERVGAACKGLKELAINENIAVVTGSQFRRKAKDDGAPTLGHLRESGDIEQDADVCMLIYHDDPWHGVLLAKQRNGVTGKVQLMWERKYTAWRNAPPYIAQVERGSR